VTERSGKIFGDRHTRADLKAGGQLFKSRFTIIADKVKAVQIAAKNVDTDCDIAIEQIRLGKAKLNRLREAGIADACAQFLSLAAEVALTDGGLQNEILDAGETGRKLQFASGALLDIRFQYDAIRRAALLLLNFQRFLEKAE